MRECIRTGVELSEGERSPLVDDAGPVGVAGRGHRDRAPDGAEAIDGAEYGSGLARRVDAEHAGAEAVEDGVALDGTAKAELGRLAKDRRKVGHGGTVPDVSQSTDLLVLSPTSRGRAANRSRIATLDLNFGLARADALA
jgi:hypothetical protein